MFLRILKKDLQRRKATNAILLVFIMLASMFISSSVNNVMAILGGIDSFWEKANMPHLVAMYTTDVPEEDIVASLEYVDSCDTIPVLFANTNQLTHKGKVLEEFTPYIFPYAEQKMRYFDENNDPITGVAPGTVRISASTLRKAKLETGDEITIEVGGVTRTLTIAGPLKDPTNIGRRYMLNPDDFSAVAENPEAHLGAIDYIYTGESTKAEQALLDVAVTAPLTYTRPAFRTSFFPEMILAGILLAVSLCLMLIAFLVLRFTISFTLTKEFKQIGVMKAIGLPNIKIRGLYLAKYLLLATIGAVAGFFGSIPFSKLLLDSVSRNMVLGNENSMLINALCSVFVVVITLAFCYLCTAKVKKFTPVDAIRNGTTGERFLKKGLLRLTSTPGKPTLFLALNDVLSQPRRFGAVILTLFLCLSLVLMLTTSVNTLKSSGLIPAFDITRFHLICSEGGFGPHFTPDGRQQIEGELAETETLLKENGFDCRCYAEMQLSLPLLYQGRKYSCFVSQGVGTSTDQYTYLEGSAPSGPGEIAITAQVSQALDAHIGDTVIMQIGEEAREFLVTGFYQTMMDQGKCVRVHQDEDISYEYLTTFWGMQIQFRDNPGKEEIQERGARIRELLDIETTRTEAEYVEFLTAMAGTLEKMRMLMLVVSVVITVLITSLIGYSFITKEISDIAILKAIGFKDGQIILWQTLRFAIVCIIATILALVFHLPLMNLAIDPIFTEMGANYGIKYEVVPLEIFCIYPVIFFAITTITGFLTAQHVRTVQTNECSNIE